MSHGLGTRASHIVREGGGRRGHDHLRTAHRRRLLARFCRAAPRPALATPALQTVRADRGQPAHGSPDRAQGCRVTACRPPRHADLSQIAVDREICIVCGEPLAPGAEDVMCGRCEIYVGDDDPEVSVARLDPYWLDYFISGHRPPDQHRIYSDGENPGWYAWYWARGRDPFDPKPYKRRIPESLRLAVITRDGLTCQLCGLPVGRADIHIDHRIPEIAGGPTTLENLQVAHSFCNISKGARLHTEAC